MKNVFILLLLGTASLFCIACSGENSVLTDGDAVLLQPGVHAGATLASTRSMINDVGTGADRISTIGIYLAAADGSLYPAATPGERPSRKRPPVPIGRALLLPTSASRKRRSMPGHPPRQP